MKITSRHVTAIVATIFVLIVMPTILILAGWNFIDCLNKPVMEAPMRCLMSR